MYPRQHIILGLFFSLALFLIYPSIGLIGATIVFASSVLIDIDHYLYYVYKKRDLSLGNAVDFFNKKLDYFLSLPRSKRNNLTSDLLFLHGLEVILFLFIISFFSNLFLFIFLGFSFHLLLDLVQETVYWDKIDKFSLINSFSKLK